MRFIGEFHPVGLYFELFLIAKVIMVCFVLLNDE